VRLFSHVAGVLALQDNAVTSQSYSICRNT